MHGQFMRAAMVLAQDTATGSAPGTGGTDGGLFDGLGMFVPLLLIIVVMYFIMIRPQRKQQKQREEMLSQMKKNDRVMTIGGIEGVIYSINDQAVTLKIDERNDVRIRVARSAIGRVLGDEETPDAGPGTA